MIGQFLLAAVQPSTDPALIAASLRGIAITVAVALWSWLFSLFLGVIGGVLSAEVVSRTLWGGGWPALLLRRLLAIPRSLHELLWGLILLQLLGLHPAVAVLAIALPYGALFARVVAEQLDGLPRSNLEALYWGRSGSRSAVDGTHRRCGRSCSAMGLPAEWPCARSPCWGCLALRHWR